MLEALKKGNTVVNPEFWKKIQNLINLVGGMSAFIVILFPSMREYLTVENLQAFGGTIAALNIYFTTATTTTIGWK